MGVTYLEKAKPNNGLCKNDTSPALNLLSSSSEQECPILHQICTVNIKKLGKLKQYKSSTTNNTDPISWSKVLSSPAVAKRRRCKDAAVEIGESDGVKTSFYNLNKISGTGTVLQVPKERGDCAAVETQTVVSSVTLKLIDKRCNLNRITFPKFGGFCCCVGCNDKAHSMHGADSFESIDLNTPHKISTLNSTICNIIRYYNSSTTAKRTKFNAKVAQILNKVKKYRKTSKETKIIQKCFV